MNPNRAGMKSSKMNKGRNASKKVEKHWTSRNFLEAGFFLVLGFISDFILVETRIGCYSDWSKDEDT